MNKLFLAAAIVSAIALAGCASQPEQPAPPPPSQANGATTSTTGAQGTATQPVESIPEAPPKAGPQSSYENRVIYFATDKSVVKPAFFALLRRQADYLNAHPDQKVMLEGYADERSTREYNLALGARRAAAVRKFLLLQGVDKDQIDTISYGEAYPADPGHGPEAWAKNRRVVLNFHPQLGRSGTQPGNP